MVGVDIGQGRHIGSEKSRIQMEDGGDCCRAFNKLARPFKCFIRSQAE